jgi:CRP-like cAMP-binding protein
MRARPRFVDITERMIYLRAIPVATMLPAPVLKVIAEALRERAYSPGALLMRQGEPIDALQFLIEGKVALTRNDKPLGHLQPPQSLGFLGIIARADGTYHATAEVETHTLELPAETLLELMEDHFSIVHATLRYAAERLWADLQELPAEAMGFPFVESDRPIPDRRLDMVERIFFLRKLSAFAHANVNALAVMSEQLEEIRIQEPGVVLWRPGDPPDHVLMLVKGTVACATEDGAKRFRYGPGTAVGGVEAVADKPRWYSVTTEGPIVALKGRTDHMFDLFEDNFPMAMDFIATLSSALIGMMERKAAMGQQALSALRSVSKLGAVPVGA